MGTGPLDGGNQIGVNGSSGLAEVIYFAKPGSVTATGVGTRAFQDVKDNFFGSQDKDGRELVFHYAVFGDYYELDSDGTNYSWHVASAGTDFLVSASALPNAVSGDVVKITSGRGAGQNQVIASFVPNQNQINIRGTWTTIPDNSSTFSIFSGSSGLSEVFINPAPDFNSLPGNDVIITLGAVQLNGGIINGVLGTACQQWRTLAHELGHTLGLRHGGIDNEAHKGGTFASLMSYDYQLQCRTVSTVQSYSSSTAVFNDWANLQGNFADSEMHLGNTMGIGFGSFPEVSQQDPEQSVQDYINQNGGYDSQPPTVAINSPANNGKVGLTLPLQVTVTATDNAAVGTVTVSFDANGNGTIDPSEVVLAKLSGTNTYKATYSTVGGNTGTRTITASAVDASGNSSSTHISVNVVNPNPVPALASMSPNTVAHGSPGFTLTVNGSNLVAGCTVLWNGAARTTTFVNGGQVTAKIQSSDIAAAGTATVTVRNPAPGGGTSNGLTFTIQ